MKAIFPIVLGIGTALSCAAQADNYATDTEVQLTIQQPLLNGALNDWAVATGFQVIAEDTSGLPAPTLRGMFTPKAALEALLIGTSLSYQFLDDRTVVIRSRARSRSAAGWNTTSSVGVRSGFKLARADLADQASTPVRVAAAEKVAIASAAPDDNVEEVVVTGSNIRGSEPAGAEIVVITSEDITKNGYGRIQDVIATLTQNFKGASEEFNQPNSNNNFGADIQLRGLGPGTTLTLVNGLRQPAGGSTGAFVEIASIQVAAIE